MKRPSKREIKFAVSSEFDGCYRKYCVDGSKAKSNYQTFVEQKGAIPPRQLPRGMNDHALIGRLDGYRQCHLDGNVLLIYSHENDIVTSYLICEHDDIEGPREASLLKRLKK